MTAYIEEEDHENSNWDEEVKYKEDEEGETEAIEYEEAESVFIEDEECEAEFNEHEEASGGGSSSSSSSGMSSIRHRGFILYVKYLVNFLTSNSFEPVSKECAKIDSLYRRRSGCN